MFYIFSLFYVTIGLHTAHNQSDAMSMIVIDATANCRYLLFPPQQTNQKNEWGQLAMESVFTKYYGGPIDSVFSPEQMEKSEDDDSYNETVV